MALGLDSKILIVDDLPSMRSDLVRILTELGFQNMKQCEDGKQAWDHLRAEALNGNYYEIIFSDINMPEMDGLTLLKHLRGVEGYKKIPIFIVSTENEKSTIIKAIMGGATDYIIKPYDPFIVKEKVMGKLKKG
ncbi:response regulator [Bacteriovorax sp. PP10]|uniref:Response regulator n=1 Tax=Bacteriovorax antarcticus TaxID=3088717 RepID=A0ABU5W2C4_9BACT|nr:response regulator [Bacteriovorax sp. PP10]MEA9358385.1 response regulator [Bacteriovorax sp. PP10]